MAVLRLELDVDSVVHPELYEALAAIDDSAHWAERLRHLASTGLVLQRLRVSPDGVVGGQGGERDAPVPPALDPAGPPAPESVAPSRLALVVSPGVAPPAALDLPVLLDEVPADQWPREPLAATEAAATPRSDSVADPASLSFAESLPMPPSTAVDGEPPAESTGSMHMSGRRARLLRMRNRGLFNNE